MCSSPHLSYACALALLAVLSLVARWADAPCGCAEHNGWVELAGELTGHGTHDHAHGEHDGPALTHDCGGTGRVSFASAARVAPVGGATFSPPVPLPDAFSSLVSSDPDDLSPAATPPSRAALNVYRV